MRIIETEVTTMNRLITLLVLGISLAMPLAAYAQSDEKKEDTKTSAEQRKEELREKMKAEHEAMKAEREAQRAALKDDDKDAKKDKDSKKKKDNGDNW
jgi:Ni/Co efflux regulator RcnB